MLAAVCAAAHVRSESGLCFDEPKRIASSFTMLEHAAFASRDGTPLSIVYGLPFSADERSIARGWDPTAVRANFSIWERGLELLSDSGPPDTLVRARLPSVFVFLVLLVLIAWEGRRLAGPSGCVVAVALVGTSPALLSHAGLASPDLLATTVSVGFAIALRAFVAHGGAARGVVVAVLAGLTIAAKLTCVAILASACVALLIPKHRDWRRFAGAIAACAIGVVLAELGYRAFGSSLREPIDAARSFSGSALSTYFLGTFGDPGPWFYPVITFGKATPLLLGALVLAPFVLAFQRASRPAASAAWIAYGLPALGLLGGLVLSDFAQGYRFVLPAFALLALAVTPTFARVLDSPARGVRALAAVALLAQAIATGAAHPDHLAYWNVFVGGFDGGSRIAVDSNADWGQATPALLRYAEAERLDTVFALLNTIEPTHAPLVGLPALAWQLATAAPLEHSAIAVSTTYVRMAEIDAARSGNPLLEFVRALHAVPPQATPGHAIHVWRFTPEVEALAREHLGKYLKR